MKYTDAIPIVNILSLLAMNVFTIYISRIRRKDSRYIKEWHKYALLVSISAFGGSFILYLLLDYLVTRTPPSITAVITSTVVFLVFSISPTIILVKIIKK